MKSGLRGLSTSARRGDGGDDPADHSVVTLSRSALDLSYAPLSSVRREQGQSVVDALLEDLVGERLVG